MMQLNSKTWGHVALATQATKAMESAEEENEIAMLRCRFAGKPAPVMPAALSGLFPGTRQRFNNPGTLRAIAEIFDIHIDQALFALTIH